MGFRQSALESWEERGIASTGPQWSAAPQGGKRPARLSAFIPPGCTWTEGLGLPSGKHLQGSGNKVPRIQREPCTRSDVPHVKRKKKENHLYKLLALDSR